MRHISCVAGMAGAFLLAQTQLAFSGNWQLFAGRWNHQSSLTAGCNGCVISIVQHGSALLLLTNMGWGTAMEADRTGLATFAEGRAVDADGRLWVVSCAVANDKLYVIATPEDGAAPSIKSIFIQE